jgi:serine/threonine protein kinase
MRRVQGPWSRALKVMHEEPKPIYHRDIRWENIVKSGDDPKKWFLIDWDDASTPPTVAAKHLDPRTHAPSVFGDNHGPEVDIWAVGQLIEECHWGIAGFPVELLKIGEAMKSGTLNLQQSIEKITAFEAATNVAL